MRLCLILFPLCLCALAYAQDAQSAPDQARIKGNVVNSVTGEPIRKAKVTLMNMGAPQPAKNDAGPPTVVTDASGGFEFAALAPGGYALSASHDGFNSVTKNGQMRLRRVTVAAGDSQEVTIRLEPFGVVTGRILDEDGDPIRSMQVQVMTYRYSAAGRRLAEGGSATTNDLGQYRIYDLPTGRYFLRAGSPDSMGGADNNEAYGVSYYPGTLEVSSASPVELAAGETLDGMDVTLRPTRIATIRGRVMNSGIVLTVGLRKSTDDGEWTTTMNTLDNSGKFTLRGVSPGSYVLTANGTVGGQHLRAGLPIQVGTSDLEGIELRLQPPVEIAGQIRVEGKTGEKLSHMMVVLNGQGLGSSSPAKEDGSFTIESLDPAVYTVSVTGGPPDLYLKSVRLAEKDVTQSGVDLTQGAGEARLTLTMSANGGQIDGVVADDQSAPVARAVVTLIPTAAQASKDQYKWTETSPAGHFVFRGIAPGDYKLYAWEDVDVDEALYDPDFLKAYEPRAKSLEISEGSQQSVQLAVIASPQDKQPQ